MFLWWRHGSSVECLMKACQVLGKPLSHCSSKIHPQRDLLTLAPLSPFSPGRPLLPSGPRSPSQNKWMCQNSYQTINYFPIYTRHNSNREVIILPQGSVWGIFLRWPTERQNCVILVGISLFQFLRIKNHKHTSDFLPQSSFLIHLS